MNHVRKQYFIRCKLLLKCDFKKKYSYLLGISSEKFIIMTENKDWFPGDTNFLDSNGPPYGFTESDNITGIDGK